MGLKLNTARFIIKFVAKLKSDDVKITHYQRHQVEFLFNNLCDLAKFKLGLTIPYQLESLKPQLEDEALSPEMKIQFADKFQKYMRMFISHGIIIEWQIEFYCELLCIRCGFDVKEAFLWLKCGD